MENESPQSFKADEIQLRQQELERARLFIAFAKYGFAGTLTGAIIGLVTVLCLAAVSAFTCTKIETWGLVAIATIV